MKFNKWSVLFIFVLIGIVFVSWEFFVTSRMTLNIFINYPEGISKDVVFDMKIYSDKLNKELSVDPKKNVVSYSNLPFGDYFFEISLDDRLLIKEFHGFKSQFSIKKKKESINLDVSELASITSVSFKIKDPYLSVKWSGKYLGAFKPAEYLVYLNGVERRLNVNYTEIDLLKELLGGRENINIKIIPLTQNSEEILAFDYVIPIRMQSANLDIPNGFNVYDMSINVQQKRIPIDPYEPKINFPVVDQSDDTIPFEIYYYEDIIWKSQLKLSDSIENIKLPRIPEASVTSVELEESTVTINLTINKEQPFLYNQFKFFEITGESIDASSTGEFIYHNDYNPIFITPLFEPDIRGETLSFKVPKDPTVKLHTYMYDEKGVFAPRFKFVSQSPLNLSGKIIIDNKKERLVNGFNGEYVFEENFSESELHLISIQLSDDYGQKSQMAKWISTAVPETTFFTEIILDKNMKLEVKWDELEIYEETELIVTDNYNIKRFYPEGSQLTTDLSETLLREPLKIIIKGFYNDEEYTAGVIEGIKSE